MKGEKGIIFAADLVDEVSCLQVIEEISGFIDAIKIGYPLILNTGIQIVHKIKEICNLPVIADLKIMDISSVAGKIVATVVKAGCDGVVVCGQCGPGVIFDCMQEAEDKMVIVFNEFTHFDGLITEEVANDTAKIAKDLGAYGIQVPGTKPHRIQKLREIVGNNLIIIACGIGAQGPSPGTAIKTGADYEIIGRAIYTSQNPKRSVEEIKKIISSFL